MSKSMKTKNNDNELETPKNDEFKSASSNSFEITRKTSSNSLSKNTLIHKSQSYTLNTNEPKSPYNALTHQMRKLVPHELACLVGCQGIKCKYCNSNWNDEFMELKGVYSSWITDEMLAMARPTTHAIKEFKLIEQMKK
jgi:protein tyrosine phosphatase domain-containing protein 1